MKKIITGILALLPLYIFAQTNHPADQLLPLDPAVRTGKMANGFTYYIRHNEEPKNRVIFYLANKVGSVLEEDDQRGLAHFMEHMSFNGTKHFPKNELVNYLQKSGVRFGADLNAYTGFDETVYQLPLPSNNAEILNNGIQIMRDWAHEATLDPVEIDKERGVVLEEKRLGKGAGERMQRQIFPVILNNSRYAFRIPIGTDEVLNNFKPEAISRFYQNWYRPDLQALIVVGDIDVDQMEQMIKVKFGDLKNPAHEKVRTKYTIPLTGAGHFIAVTDKEETAAGVDVLIKFPAQALKTAADYRATLITQLFNSMLGQRYSELSRQANPPFISGSAGIAELLGGLNNFDVSVTAKPGELESGFKAVWRETDRVKHFGFTPTELERAKNTILNYMSSALKEKDKTSSQSYVKEYLAYFLKGAAAPGIDSEYQLVQKQLPGITLQDINDLVKSTIAATNRDVIIKAPEKDKTTLPDESTLVSWMKAVEQEQLNPYQDKVNTGSLLAVQPVPGKIINEQKDEKLAISTLTLSNGLKVVLKPTDFKADQILFNGFAPGGTSVYPDADFQSANNAVALISASGVGNYSKNELSKFLSGKQLGVAPYISERSQGISGGSNKANLETAMQLVYAYFAEPRKDAPAFEGLIARSKAAMANRANDPNTVFQDTASALLGRNSIRRTGPSVQKLEQISIDKAYGIYKDCFADAAKFTFVFTGSFDMNEIKPLLEKYLGSLPATHQNQQAKDLHITPPEGRITKIVYKGTEPKATVQLVYTGGFDYTIQNNTMLQALKETLQIRLLERLREDESGVYSPGVSISTSKFPQGRFGFVIHFGCAPENADKLIASALDEVNKLKTLGPPQGNLDKFKAEDKLSRETQLKTNSFWLGYISGQLQNKEDLDKEIDDYPAEMDKITTLSIKETARKYLDSKNFIKLELLPETSKP